jgi:hypothetical protein
VRRAAGEARKKGEGGSDPTLEEVRRVIAAQLERFHRRIHSGLDDRIPLEVRQTREDLQQQAA